MYQTNGDASVDSAQPMTDHILGCMNRFNQSASEILETGHNIEARLFGSGPPEPETTATPPPVANGFHEAFSGSAEKLSQQLHRLAVLIGQINGRL